MSTSRGALPKAYSHMYSGLDLDSFDKAKSFSQRIHDSGSGGFNSLNQSSASASASRPQPPASSKATSFSTLSTGPNTISVPAPRQRPDPETDSLLQDLRLNAEIAQQRLVGHVEREKKFEAEIATLKDEVKELKPLRIRAAVAERKLGIHLGCDKSNEAEIATLKDKINELEHIRDLEKRTSEQQWQRSDEQEKQLVSLRSRLDATTIHASMQTNRERRAAETHKTQLEDRTTEIAILKSEKAIAEQEHFARVKAQLDVFKRKSEEHKNEKMTLEARAVAAEQALATKVIAHVEELKAARRTAANSVDELEHKIQFLENRLRKELQTNREEHFDLSVTKRSLEHASKNARNLVELSGSIEMQLPVLERMMDRRINGVLAVHEEIKKRVKEEDKDERPRKKARVENDNRSSREEQAMAGWSI